MKRSLARNSIYNIIYQLLNVVFPLISVGYVSRILSPDGIGRVAYAQNIVSYFVMFAALGIPSYGVREIAKQQNNSSERNTVFSELIFLMAISTSVCILGYLLFGQISFSGERMLYWVVGLELLFCFVSIDWFYQGMEEYAYIITRNIIVKAVSLLALVVFVKDRSDYGIYAGIHCMGIGCNQLFNICKARKWVRLTTKGLNLRRHLAPIFWLMISSVAASLYHRVDVTMLGTMSPKASVAYYTNAHKVIGIALGMVTALTAVFLPRLSLMFETDKGRYSRYVSTGLELILTLAVPACVGIYIVAENLMLCLFGPEFLPGAGVLKTLAVFLLVKGVGDLLCYQVIVSSGNERKLIQARVVAGIVNVILNLILIPAFAHLGAAIASVISELIVNGMLLRRALSIVNTKLPGRLALSIVVSTVCMALFAWMIQTQLEDGALSLIVTVSAGVLSYVCMMVLTKNPVILMVNRHWKQKVVGNDKNPK